MTKREKIKYAQKTVCAEMGCPPDSFEKSENVVFESDTQFFEYTTFGGNAVIRADKKIFDWCAENFLKMPASEIPEIDGGLFLIESKLREHGKELFGEHIRFLRLNENVRIEKPPGFSFEIYEADRIPELYADKRFTQAFNFKSDRIAIVARDGGETAAIAAADDFVQGFFQIGIDTVPEFRGRGLAAYLVNAISVEIESRGHVPFYNTWAANIASMRVAVSAGFCPAWLSYFTSKKRED